MQTTQTPLTPAPAPNRPVSEIRVSELELRDEIRTWEELARQLAKLRDHGMARQARHRANLRWDQLVARIGHAQASRLVYGRALGTADAASRALAIGDRFGSAEAPVGAADPGTPRETDLLAFPRPYSVEAAEARAAVGSEVVR